jgi:hypothetical protein
MTRRRAYGMGALAILPGVLFVLIFVCFFALMANDLMRQNPPHQMPVLFVFMFPLHCLLMGVCVTGLVLFIIDVFRNPHVAENLRPMWMVLFFFVGLVTVPLYWFLYIWQPLRGGGQVSP